MKRSTLLRLINFWPPYIGAGIRVKKISDDIRTIDVEMKLRFWNRNIVGTQFGGSLYAMTDPFFMLILMENLGHDFIVWDKAASIQFKKPGKGAVHARFHVSAEEIESIRQRALSEYKVEPTFIVSIMDSEQVEIAQVEKLLYVRKKEKKNA